MSNQGLSYAKNMERSAEQAGGGARTEIGGSGLGVSGLPVDKIGAQ